MQKSSSCGESHAPISARQEFSSVLSSPFSKENLTRTETKRIFGRKQHPIQIGKTCAIATKLPNHSEMSFLSERDFPMYGIERKTPKLCLSKTGLRVPRPGRRNVLSIEGQILCYNWEWLHGTSARMKLLWLIVGLAMMLACCRGCSLALMYFRCWYLSRKTRFSSACHNLVNCDGSCYLSVILIDRPLNFILFTFHDSKGHL